MHNIAVFLLYVQKLSILPSKYVIRYWLNQTWPTVFAFGSQRKFLKDLTQYKNLKRLNKEFDIIENKLNAWRRFAADVIFLTRLLKVNLLWLTLLYFYLGSSEQKMSSQKKIKQKMCKYFLESWYIFQLDNVFDYTMLYILVIVNHFFKKLNIILVILTFWCIFA